MIKKILGTRLFYPSYLPLLFVCIFLFLLACLVEATHETLDVALMSKTIFMVLSRRVDFAVLAEAAFLRNPTFTHGSLGSRGMD